MKYLTENEIKEALNKGAFIYKSLNSDAKVYSRFDIYRYVPPIGKVNPSMLSKLIKSKYVVNYKVPEVMKFTDFDVCYAI